MTMIHPHLTLALAQIRIDELRQSAARSAREQRALQPISRSSQGFGDDRRSPVGRRGFRRYHAGARRLDRIEREPLGSR